MSDEIRRIEEPEGIRWRGNRSLLLTLRMALRILRDDPDRAEDLIALAHGDARQIVEDADNLIKAVRSNSPALFHMINDLAQTIDGELDADDVPGEEDAENHEGEE